MSPSFNSWTSNEMPRPPVVCKTGDRAASVISSSIAVSIQWLGRSSPWQKELQCVVRYSRPSASVVSY